MKTSQTHVWVSAVFGLAATLAHRNNDVKWLCEAILSSALHDAMTFVNTKINRNTHMNGNEESERKKGTTQNRAQSLESVCVHVHVYSVYFLLHLHMSFIWKATQLSQDSKQSWCEWRASARLTLAHTFVCALSYRLEIIYY